MPHVRSARLVVGTGHDLTTHVASAPPAASHDIAAETRLEFADMLDRRDVRVVFQPIVDLRTGQIVALEALARGPEGSRFESPLAMFAAAREAGRIAELDWVCRAAAFRAVLEAEVPPSVSLFVNTEPESLGVDCPADLIRFVARAESVLRVLVEVNDRSLGADPAGVLAAVGRARELGWGIVIDNVGGSRAPVAMLPIVRADVLKLDLRLLNKATPEDSAAIVIGILRHVEQTGASLLVEGIETKEEGRWARALGATYGQGMHLGVPGPLLDHYPAPAVPVPLLTKTSDDLVIDSPFELIAGVRGSQLMGRELFEQVAAVVALSPRATGNWPVFLAGVGRDTAHGVELVEYIAGLPPEPLLFVAFGLAMEPEPSPGVRGVRLRREDPLLDETFLVILSDQAPVALFTRRTGDDIYNVAITQDPALVHRIAHHLIRRVPRPGRDNAALAPPRPAPDAGRPDPSAQSSRRGWRQGKRG